ncbi:aspartate racemase [Chryseolinea serpens]|uniref:Aspartate racemase n=1 Tax=Chryseolinea serpens TaxID=947013 RepID=A0A1M5VQY1_9BACT|nr:aspartate/glutamate racemase family protein [Chryseolinea serpens]SHH77659.1 aspartate racemase [Chryseolinea serpens]
MNTTEKQNTISRRKLIGTLGMACLAVPTAYSFTHQPEPHDTTRASSMKTIGILGGLGPQATLDLEVQIHLASQRLIPPQINSGYPPLVVAYHRRPPFVVKGDALVFPLQPDPELLELAKRLGAMVDFIIIASNGAHLVQKEIEQASGRKVLSMIDITLEEVSRRKWHTVGVAGFKNAMVYIQKFSALGLVPATIDEALQLKLDASIMRVMEGRDTAEDHAIALEVVSQLCKQNVDGIIPGCTEIPLLLKENLDDVGFVHPIQLLAEAAVKQAMT